MSYEVEITQKKVDALVASLDKATSSAEATAKAIDKVGAATEEVRTVNGRVVQAPMNPADTPNRTVTRAETYGPRDTQMPWNRGSRMTLAREERALQLVEGSGDEDIVRDARARVARARRRVAGDDRLLDGTPAKTQDELFMRMMMRSRILPGGVLSPLMMDAAAYAKGMATPAGASAAATSLKAIGIGQAADLAPAIASAAKAAMPLLIGGGLAAAGGAALFGLAEAGDDRMRRSNAALYAMGGTPGGVGAALALGGDNAAAKAMVLGDRLRQGSYGSAYFRSQGIMDYGPYQTDKSSNYVAALDALRRVPDIQQRIRIARDTGLTDDLWTSDLSDATYRQLKRSYGRAGSIEDRRAEAEYRASKEIAGNSLDRLWRNVAKTPMDFAGAGFRALTDPRGEIERTKMDLFSARGLFGESVGDWWDRVHSGISPENNPKSMSYKGPKTRGTSSPSIWDRATPRQFTDGQETINGSLNGAVSVGWRGMAAGEHFENARQMMGGYNV